MPIEKEQELHCEYVDLDTLLERSDVVSCTARLTNETRGMMGAEQFKKMKKNAIIVNEARGAVIDDAALEFEPCAPARSSRARPWTSGRRSPSTPRTRCASSRRS